MTLNAFRRLFAQAEARYGLPAGLLAAVARQESNYNPLAVSPVGALGLMQFMPDTAAELGVRPFDPASAIDGAGRLLASHFRTFKSWPHALAAYNWGPGNLLKKGFAAAPRETRVYVANITARAGIPFTPPAEWGAA